MALACAGCVAANPAFGDSGTSGASGGATATIATTRAETSTETQSSDGRGGTSSSTMSSADTGVGSTAEHSTSITIGDTEPAGDWWDEGYGFRLRIKFNARDAPLEGFVTPVTLEFGESTLVDVAPEQLQFVDVLTGEPLAVELVLFQAEKGTVVAWLRLPVWAAEEPTLVDAYFDSDVDLVPHVSPWHDYAAVWHMDVLAGNATPDAAQGNDAAMLVNPAATPMNTGAGVVGLALEFDGANHRLGATLDAPPDVPTFLVTAWSRPDAVPAEGTPILARGQRWGDAASDTEWMMGFGPGVLRGRVHDVFPPVVTLQVSSPPLGDWIHHAFLVSETSVRLYRNGQPSAMTGLDGGFEHVLEQVSIGGYASDASGWEGRVFGGHIDEVWWRVGDDVDDLWVSTLYQSQLQPETTYDYGGVEAL